MTKQEFPRKNGGRRRQMNEACWLPKVCLKITEPQSVLPGYRRNSCNLSRYSKTPQQRFWNDSESCRLSVPLVALRLSKRSKITFGAPLSVTIGVIIMH